MKKYFVKFARKEAGQMDRKKDLSCFRYMGANERRVITEWLWQVQPKNSEQEVFLKRVLQALEQVNYDYRIATIEPSLNEFDDVFYKEGSKIQTNMNFYDWQNAAERFYSDNEWHSELANLYEGDLLKAYNMATGYWSLNAISSGVHSEWQNSELYQLYDSFVVVKTRYDGRGRQFPAVFDFIGREIAIFASNVHGVIALKRK